MLNTAQYVVSNCPKNSNISLLISHTPSLAVLVRGVKLRIKIYMLSQTTITIKKEKVSAMVEKGKLVKITYDGYVNGKLFDTTNEELAKKEGIYNPRMIYGPATIAVGEGMVLPGLDEALLEMEVGEEKELVLPPEKAFGKRDPSKVRVVPIKEFQRFNIRPVVGMPVNIDGNVGKVVSINSGRVLVDFNHELAGKTVKYTLKIEDVIEEPEEIVKELIKLYAPRIDVDDLKIKLTKIFSWQGVINKFKFC